MDVQKPGLGLSLFSSAILESIVNSSMVMESFSNHMPSLVQPKCFNAIGKNQTVSRVSLHDLFKFVLSLFESEEAIQAGDTRHIWNL